MASRILCPQCESAFAYSPALLGKTVKCRQCQHTFVVATPPADPAPPVATEPPVAAKALAPPPLPAKVVTDRGVERRTRRREADDRRQADDPPRPRRRDDADEIDAPAPRRRSDRAAPRSSGTGVLIGLIAVCVLGVLAIGGGIAWAVWPGSAKTAPANQTAAVPVPPPVVQEPPKNFDEIINNIPKRENPPPAGPGPDFGPPPVRPRRPGDPGLPNGVPVKPPEPRPAPAFVPVAVLPIRPPPPAGPVEDKRLPAPAEFGVLAGGGRLILLSLPREKQVAVFDVTTTKITYLEVADPRPMIAGGMNHFLIYQPGRNTVERYSTRTLEKEGTGTFPGQPTALAMGSASNGPLVAAVAGGRNAPRAGRTALGYFDPVTLRELAYEVAGEGNVFGLGEREVALRVSADGTVATAWTVPHSSGAECEVLEGDRVVRRRQTGGPRAQQLFPSADGQTLFARGRLFTPDLLPIGGERGEAFKPVCFVPAPHGDFHLALAAQERPGLDRHPPKGEIYLGRDPRPVLALGGLPEVAAPEFMDRKEDFDQKIFLIPEAKLLVTIDAADKTRLVLRRVDLDEAVAKTDLEYLYVTSRPPGTAVPGETYKYAPAVKAKPTAWKVTVESGPKGMAVSGDGVITWAVPTDLAAADVGVILKFAAGGKEVFQTVRVAVKKAK